MRHPHPPAPHSAVCSSPACSYTLYIIESSSFVFPVRCISHRSTLRQPVQHAAPVIAAHWLFCICGFVFFWQQSLFVLAAFFIYVPCLVKSPYQGCVWPYKAFWCTSKGCVWPSKGCKRRFWQALFVILSGFLKKYGLLDEEQEQAYRAAAAVGFCQKECVLLLGKDDGVGLSKVSSEWRSRQQGCL